MNLKKIFLCLSIFISSSVNSHIHQIDVLNDNVFLFYDMHITDAIIKNPILIKKLYNADPSILPKGAYFGVNHTQALSTMKAIKEIFNIETIILTFETKLDDIELYNNIIYTESSDSTSIFPKLSYLIAKFEKFPIIHNIEFRRFLSHLNFLIKQISSHKEFLELQPSKIEKIKNILKQILNELLNSNKIICDKTKNYFIPALNYLILENKLCNKASLLSLLQAIDISELEDVCAELLDYRALNIILSNPNKKHFIFMGGAHCENIKDILINHCGYKLNTKKSYKEEDENPINIKKYFDTFFPKKPVFKSPISRL